MARTPPAKISLKQALLEKMMYIHFVIILPTNYPKMMLGPLFALRR
jgi:hypothetical protein